MPALEGIFAILGTFGMAPLIVYLRGKHKLREKELEIEAQRQKALPPGSDGVKTLEEENMKLRERVENLESIVCSVDFELNQKLAKVIDEQRSLVQLPAPAQSAPTPPGLDRTATAIATPKAQPSPTVIEVGQVLAQRYRIQRLLGRGGMGAVYLADDEVLGELVALKVISSSYATDEAAMVARFRREAAAARKVSSPRVLRIHALGEARPGLLYLSMEYFAGRP